MLLFICGPSGTPYQVQGTRYKVRCEPSTTYAELVAEVEKQCEWAGEAGALRLSLNKKDQLELEQEGSIASAGIRGGDLLYIIAAAPMMATTAAGGWPDWWPRKGTSPAGGAAAPAPEPEKPAKRWPPVVVASHAAAASQQTSAPATAAAATVPRCQASEQTHAPEATADTDDVMLELPNEVLVRICVFLLPRELGKLACTSRSFGCATAWHASSNGEMRSVVEEAARRWVVARLADGLTPPVRNINSSWLRQMHTVIMAKHPDETFSDHCARQATGLPYSAEAVPIKKARAQAKAEAEARRLQNPQAQAEYLIEQRIAWAEAEKDYDDDMMAGQYDKWFPVTHWFDKTQAFTNAECFISQHGQELYDAVIFLHSGGKYLPWLQRF